MSAIAAQVFVTRQIVDEVNRNKLHKAKQACDQVREKLRFELTLPDFLDIAISQLPKEHQHWVKPTKHALLKVDESISGMLKSIAGSSDEVSIALQPIFAAAVAPDDGELVSARLRKELGNPPGKRSDPLGDQLSWEQLLRHVGQKDELWIVTRDTDYYIKDGGQCLLHPILLNELVQRGLSPAKIHVFDSLAQALEDFNAKGGVKVRHLPSKAVLATVAAEEKVRLPSFATGEEILETGIYSVQHTEHRLPHEITLLKGEKFPRCSQCSDRVRFVLVRTGPDV